MAVPAGPLATSSEAGRQPLMRSQRLVPTRRAINVVAEPVREATSERLSDRCLFGLAVRWSRYS